ncbi:MAG: hypothetical protein KDK10_04120 [Maritimibacter sp.]|nr:hypothetical protein [Maritimibacter sp.]
MKTVIVSLGLSLAAAGPAVANPVPDPHAVVEILPGWRLADGTHMAALRIALDPGWKTYWRAPGEAGIPPDFDWTGSDNVKAVRYVWPVPEVVTSNGMTTLGYHEELILPMEILPVDPDADVALTGALNMGVCDDICMPLTAEVAASLPADTTGEDARIAAALSARPDTEAEAGVAAVKCRIEEISDGLRVTVEIDMPSVGADEYLVVEPADRTIWVSEAMTARAEGRLSAEADLVPPSAKPFDLDTETLRLTVLAAGRGVDIEGCETAD